MNFEVTFDLSKERQIEANFEILQLDELNCNYFIENNREIEVTFSK